MQQLGVNHMQRTVKERLQAALAAGESFTEKMIIVTTFEELPNADKRRHIAAYLRFLDGLSRQLLARGY
jgi:hypothetical protein